MQAALLRAKKPGRRGLLYPLLIIAAVAVIIFSAIGAAALIGWLPRAQSETPNQGAQKQSEYEQPQNVAQQRDRAAAARNVSCADCGVVASITPVEVKGNANGVGLIAGGIAGALLGNQIGRGAGNALATVGGAAGGAYAGNEVEKRVNKSVRYKVSVHMDDGSYRTSYQSTQPVLRVGDKVRVRNGHVALLQ